MVSKTEAEKMLYEAIEQGLLMATSLFLMHQAVQMVVAFVRYGCNPREAVSRSNVGIVELLGTSLKAAKQGFTADEQ